MLIVLARVDGDRIMAARRSEDRGSFGIEYVKDLASFVAAEERATLRGQMNTVRANRFETL